MLTDYAGIGEAHAAEYHLFVRIWASIQEICNYLQKAIEIYLIK